MTIFFLKQSMQSEEETIYCWGFDVAAPEWWLIFEEKIEFVRKNIRHLPLKIK